MSKARDLANAGTAFNAVTATADEAKLLLF
jgi:hypothetical protein